MEQMNKFMNTLINKIIDGNVMNMSLIIMEGKYGAVYADDYSCYGY